MPSVSRVTFNSGRSMLYTCPDSVARSRGMLRDRHLVHQIDVLYRVEQGDPIAHRTHEGLTTGDQAHPARSLVDHRRPHRLLQIALTRRGASRVDQPAAAEIAVDHLVAREVDGMVAAQLVVHPGRRLAELQDLEAVVDLGQLLLDDVRLDGHAQMV